MRRVSLGALSYPFTVRYVPGYQSVLAHLFGSPSIDQYEVLDASGSCVGSFLTGNEAAEMCWRYNEIFRTRKAAE